MDKANTETDTTLAKVEKKDNILRIGRRIRCSKPKNTETQGYEKANFKSDSLTYFSQLLMGNRTTTYTASDTYTTDEFDYKFISEANQPSRCHFICKHNVNRRRDGYYYSGMLINAETIMHEIRKRLKDKNWISKYVLELPPRSPADKAYYQVEEEEVRDVIREVHNEQSRKIYKFIYQLHREYVKEPPVC